MNTASASTADPRLRPDVGGGERDAALHDAGEGAADRAVPRRGSGRRSRPRRRPTAFGCRRLRGRRSARARRGGAPVSRSTGAPLMPVPPMSIAEPRRAATGRGHGRPRYVAFGGRRRRSRRARRLSPAPARSSCGRPTAPRLRRTHPDLTGASRRRIGHHRGGRGVPAAGRAADGAVGADACGRTAAPDRAREPSPTTAVFVDGDTVIADLPAGDLFPMLLDVAERLGDVTYVDARVRCRSSSSSTSRATAPCSVVLTLQGRGAVASPRRGARSSRSAAGPPPPADGWRTCSPPVCGRASTPCPEEASAFPIGGVVVGSVGGMADAYSPPIATSASSSSTSSTPRRSPSCRASSTPTSTRWSGSLEEFGRFCAEVLAAAQPRRRHARLDATTPTTGAVTTPPGWKEAYAKYVEAGWGSVPFPGRARRRRVPVAAGDRRCRRC